MTSHGGAAAGRNSVESLPAAGKEAGPIFPQAINSRPLWVAGAMSLLVLLGPFLPAARFFSAPSDYLPFHTLLEFLSITISAMVFSLGWNLRWREDNGRHLLLALGALCVALIDLAHTLSFSGMPDFVTPSGPEKAINFWLAGRFIAAAVLLAIAFLPALRWTQFQCWLGLLAALGLAGGTWWLGLVEADALPRTFIPGQGLTSFKIVCEYALALAYAGAACALVWQAGRQQRPILAWLAAAAWVLGLAELFFTLYQDVTDLFNLLGHVYKAVAYLMIYRAVFVAGVAAPYEELSASERRLRYTMAATGEGLWEWDVTSGLVRHNSHWYTLLGKPEQTAAQPLAEYLGPLHEADRAAMVERLNACRDGGGYYYSEHRLRREDGAYLWVMDRGDVVERDAAGQAVRLAGSIRDISELREARLSLELYRDHLEELVGERTAELEKARADAERLARVKSEFLANMSHEIRTPMNAIVGIAHIMSRDGVTSRQAAQLGKINAAADHLLAVINDILDFSKIEAGKMSIEHTELTIGALLDNVRAILSPRLAEKGLALDIDCEALPARLRGDPTRLLQALLNYANNAIKFTAHGGIVLRVRRQLERPEAILLRFEVEDSGIGIAEQDQERLFNAFEQADGSTTREYGGTGLGLAITKRLAELMGGEVGMSSRPGCGSLFWFSAWLEKAGPAPHAEHAPAPDAPAGQSLMQGGGQGLRFLLAEDEPVNQEITIELLTDSGAHIDLAHNGQQAVEMAGRQRYDLILMDMQMPLIDGLTATRLIRTLPGGQAVPIIAMTANAFAEDRAQCLAAGMNDFLAKPVDPAVLDATIARWLLARPSHASSDETSEETPTPAGD